MFTVNIILPLTWYLSSPTHDPYFFFQIFHGYFQSEYFVYLFHLSFSPFFSKFLFFMLEVWSDVSLLGSSTIFSSFLCNFVPNMVSLRLVTSVCISFYVDYTLKHSPSFFWPMLYFLNFALHPWNFTWSSIYCAFIFSFTFHLPLYSHPLAFFLYWSMYSHLFPILYNIIPRTYKALHLSLYYDFYIVLLNSFSFTFNFLCCISF